MCFEDRIHVMARGEWPGAEPERPQRRRRTFGEWAFDAAITLAITLLAVPARIYDATLRVLGWTESEAGLYRRDGRKLLSSRRGERSD